MFKNFKPSQDIEDFAKFAAFQRAKRAQKLSQANRVVDAQDEELFQPECICDHKCQWHQPIFAIGTHIVK